MVQTLEDMDDTLIACPSLADRPTLAKFRSAGRSDHSLRRPRLAKAIFRRHIWRASISKSREENRGSRRELAIRSSFCACGPVSPNAANGAPFDQPYLHEAIVATIRAGQGSSDELDAPGACPVVRRLPSCFRIASPALRRRRLAVVRQSASRRRSLRGWSGRPDRHATAAVGRRVEEMVRNFAAQIDRPLDLSGQNAIALREKLCGIVGRIAVSPEPACARLAFWARRAR